MGTTAKRGSAAQRACAFLAAHGPQSADAVGAEVWKGRPRGRTTSSGGGGDYAAQMLLGRLRKAGLVRVVPSEGSSRWDVTPRGREVAATDTQKFDDALASAVSKGASPDACDDDT